MINATNYYYLIKQAKPPILDINRKKEIYLANISWKLNNKPIIKKYTKKKIEIESKRSYNETNSCVLFKFKGD